MNAHNPPPAPAPSILYHYTNIAAFHSIITSRSFLATQIQYLNDAKEIRHALERARELIHRKIERQPDSPHTHFLSKMAETLFSISGARLFLSAFSEEGDLLNQWRSYCPQGGVSLGLDAHMLAELASAHGFALRRCVYDPHDHDQMIEQLLADNLPQLQNTPLTTDNTSALDHHPFFHTLLEVASVIKHPAFSQEKEWRAVGGPFPHDHPASGWRPRGPHLIPHVRFSFEQFDLDSLIREVIISPSPEQDLLCDSIKDFLANQGWPPHPGPRLTRSPIPYRPGWP